MPATSEPVDEQILMCRVRCGDVEAEGILYKAYLDIAMRRAVQLGAQPADAEDYVADAFIRILCQLRRGKGPGGPLRPYLWTSLRHVAADAHRGQRGREQPTADLSVVPELGADSLPQLEIDIRHAVRSAMMSLPVRWREVLWSTEVEGQSPAELAAELGASAQAISALAYRARKALRQAYNEADPGGDPVRSPPSRLPVSDGSR
jgi:RNA polymerase sigma factor (sigma-70 family)